MLKQLLRLLVELDRVDRQELALKLGTSPVMLEQMLERLQQEGYLQQVVRGCHQTCEHCPLQMACLSRRQARIWSLTEKGRRWLQQDKSP